MDKVLKYLQGDRVIWLVSIFLAIFSLLAVYSSVEAIAYRYKGGNAEFYLFKHGIMIVTGFILMYYAHRLKFTYYSRLGQVLIWAVIMLLGLTLVFGTNINSASRWLEIPLINQRFQTSDLAKLVLVIYIARYLSINQHKLNNFKEGILPLIIPIFLVFLLTLPANFSTAALILTSSLTLLFIGRVPIKYLATIIGSGLVVLTLLVTIATVKPEVLPRLETWKNRILNFESGESSANYQAEQAKMAIANGWPLGKGPGSSEIRNTMPQSYSDMIYAIIIEEYGSIFGGIGVLLLYLILLFRSIKAATRCPKNFGKYLAVGLSLNLILQAMVNMSVAVSLIPVTGQPLPLVSMGGTSVWFTCISIGIILSVSRSKEEIELKDNGYAFA